MDKLAIGYCYGGGMVHQAFAQSLLEYVDYDWRHGHILAGIIHVGGVYIDNNRERIVRTFLEMDCPWLLQIDTDIGFAPEVPAALLKVADRLTKPIVSGLYLNAMEAGQIVPIWFHETPDGWRTAVPNEGLQRVDMVGMGCCLVHRDVFVKMAEANQNDSFLWYGRDRRVLADGSFYPAAEDETFCRRAKALGYPIWADSRICVDHHKKFVYRPVPPKARAAAA